MAFGFALKKLRWAHPGVGGVCPPSQEYPEVKSAALLGVHHFQVSGMPEVAPTVQKLYDPSQVAFHEKVQS